MNEDIKKASERWINEGKNYKSAINKWIDKIHIENIQPEEECPTETRSDMAEYVLEQLQVYNKAGKHTEFRALFPPDNDPLKDILYEENRWEEIRKVASLQDGRILAKFGNYYQREGVYLINGDEINLVEDLIGFGCSHDKKFFAKVYEDKIDIHEGWDGRIIHSFPIPDDAHILDLKYNSIEVFQNGEQIILVTHHGIFLINKNGFEMIHGGIDESEEAPEENNDEPEKPETVPAEAKWIDGEGEWEIGQNNDQGNPVGLWKWWLAPTGHLCCETIYHGDDGNAFSFTRFHPDGTPSRKGVYINGQPAGKISWFKSENPTTEHYPHQKAGENVYETVQVIKGGYCVEEYYYNKDGNEVQEPYVSNFEVSQFLQKMAVLDHMFQNKDWKNIVEESNQTLAENLAKDHKEDQMRLLYFKALGLYHLNQKKSDPEIEETLNELLQLHNFQIWTFLDDHKYLDDAVSFAKTILKIENEEKTTNQRKEHNYRFLDYPHAAISPDDKYIALGSQDSPHIVLSLKDGKFEPTAEIEPRSSYPNIACFNYRHNVGPLLGLGSCHFKQSGSLGVYVDQIEGLKASGWDLDSESIYVLDDQKWIFSMLDSGLGFLLGCNDGYIWVKWGHSNAPVYIHIGGTIMSMDFSADRRSLIVGTYSGQVIILKFRDDMPSLPAEKTTGRTDDYLITNMSVHDEKRYLIPKNSEPLIW